MASGKVCTKCGETKPLDDFYRSKTKAGGVQSHCKECERVRSRRYYGENRNKRIDYRRRYHEENRNKVADSHRRYREENRDKIRESDRRYREENRDIINQGNKMRYAQDMRISNLLTSKKGVPYSPEEDALILGDNGMTTYQKAIELGRTYASVVTRKKRLRSREAADV